MVYEEKWYNCSISETVSDQPMPDFSKAPAERQDVLRQNWLNKNAKAVTERVNLWGPQIGFFERTGRTVAVMGDAVYPEPVIEVD